MEQEPQIYWRHRDLRFLRAYYKVIIETSGIRNGEWMEFYKERLQEIEDELERDYPEPTA